MQQNKQKAKPPTIYMLVTMSEPSAFSQAVELLISDGNAYTVSWRKRVNDLLLRALSQENAVGNKTYILSPLAMANFPAEEFSPSAGRYLLPVILSKDPYKYYERLEGIFADESIVGIWRHKMANSPGNAISYMQEHIVHIFPLFDQTLDKSENTISCKYYLPSIYRFLEEADVPSPMFFKAEAQWIALIRTDVPIGTFSFHGRSDKEKHMHQILMDIDSNSLHKTGVTAALLDLGIKAENIPLPIELATEDFEAPVATFRSKLTPLGKLEIRQFGLNHPSGNWYLSVVQFILDEQIVVMLYDLPRYMKYGIAKKGNQLSPLAVMAQICYSAWLLERRGIDRSRWVYSILLRYREKHCVGEGEASSDGEKEKYSAAGVIIDWPAHYNRRSKQIVS